MQCSGEGCNKWRMIVDHLPTQFKDISLCSVVRWCCKIALNILLSPLILAVAVLSVFRRDCDITTWLAKEKPNFFNGKTIWVTGGTSGIGRELAIALVRRGAKVIISGRKLPQLNETQTLATEHLRLSSSDPKFNSEDFVKIVDFPFEGQTPASLDGFCQKAWNWQGKIDILFNNAGFGSRGILTAPDTDMNVLTVTANVPIYLMKWFFLKHGITRDTYAQHSDTTCLVVNTCSIVSRLAAPTRVAYGAAKSALLHAAKALNLEFRVLNCRNARIVNCLPGPTATNFSLNCIRDEGKINQSMDSYLANGMTAERCATLMLRAASRGIEESWISQQPVLDMMYFNFYTPSVVDIFTAVSLMCPKTRKRFIELGGDDLAAAQKKDD